MSGKRKRGRVYFGMRNFKFETHDENGNKVSEITENEWKELIIKDWESIENPTPIELSYIFHNRDKDSEGEKKTLHAHFVARFENPVEYDSTREKFKCESRNFEKCRSETSALLYLTHTTTDAIKAKKVRYNVAELNVLTSTDEVVKRLEGEELEDWYRLKISGREGSNKVSTDDEVARIIDELSEGLLLLEDVKQELKSLYDSTTATMTWMKNKRYFKEAISEYYQNKYYDWLDNGRSFKLIYIEGASSIGKTSFARELGKEFNTIKGLRPTAIHNAPNDTKGARYDFLSSYDNEAVTVFDDLNPNTFGYTEFLNLFEKERVSKYSSRFNDKPWFAEIGIITKSTPIKDWTTKLSYSELKDVSSSEKYNVLYQPRRRFSLVVSINHDKVTISNYVLDDKKTMKHHLETLKEFQVPDKTEDYNSGFWDEKFQRKIIKAVMVALGLKEPTKAEIKKVGVDDGDDV